MGQYRLLAHCEYPGKPMIVLLGRVRFERGGVLQLEHAQRRRSTLEPRLRLSASGEPPIAAL